MYSLIIIFVLTGKFNTNVDTFQQEFTTLDLCQNGAIQVSEAIKKSNPELIVNSVCVKTKI